MRLNLQTFTPTITIKCCGKPKQLVKLLVKISIFCWKSEWDCGWDAPCAQEGKICAPAHKKAGPGLGAQTIPRDGWSPQGGLQSLPLAFGLSTTEDTSQADVSPVLAGGTCQAAERGDAILERYNCFCPWSKLPPVSCLPVNRYGISQL